MKKRMTSNLQWTLLFLVLTLSGPSQADAVRSSVASFGELRAMMEGLGPDELRHSLLVMDDDDTLTMMPCPDRSDPGRCQYLGGPAWYAWQSQLVKEGSPGRVADDTPGLLDIATLLFAVNYMAYTEPDLPEVLETLSDAGAKLLVLTARGPDTLSATEAQLGNRRVAGDRYGSFLDLIKRHALVGEGSGIASLAGPFLPLDCDARSDGKPRAVSYQQGVMYVAGQNKGGMLHCLLDRTESADIRHIFFIDDTLENVVDVYEAFADRPGPSVHALHYTRFNDHKAALTTGPQAQRLQWNAQRRWDTIKSVLERELQEPAIPTAAD